MDFELLTPPTGAETIARGAAIREIPRLRRLYGSGRWLKRKGFTFVRAADGLTYRAEIHWYEASGIGRKEFKVKRYIP
ncbi:MAG: hypothetical protein ACM3JH_12795 [Acidithiobacillales bacterium]